MAERPRVSGMEFPESMFLEDLEISRRAVVPQCFERYDRMCGSTGSVMAVVPITLCQFAVLGI